MLIECALAVALQIRETVPTPVIKAVMPIVLVEHPTPNKKVFWTGIGLLAGAKTADAIATRKLLDRGGWENNGWQGRYPSARTQTFFNLAYFAAQTGIFYVTERNKRPWVRWTGRAFMATTIVNHVQLAACNSGVDIHSVQAQNCPSLPGF